MKKTKFVALVLSAVTIFSGTVYAKTFSDVTKTGQFKWIYTELNDLSDKGIFGGYPEGDFRPNNPVSFLEIMQVIKNIKQPSESEIAEANKNYLEVAKRNGVPSWALDSVVYSLNNNTISENTLIEANKRGFLKSEKPTYPDRNSVTVYFGRALGFKGDGDTSVLKHSDIKNVPQVTLGYLSVMVNKGIFSATGSEGKFNGKLYIRRAEVVSIASKAINYLNNNSATTTDNNSSDDHKTGTLIDTASEVSGVVENIDETNKTLKVHSNEYKIDSNTKFVDMTTNDIGQLLNKEVLIKQVNGTITELSVKKDLNSEKYNAKLVGRITSAAVENDMNRLEVKILVSNNPELVSGSDIIIKTVQNHNVGDIINFDAKIEKGYVIEVNIQR